MADQARRPIHEELLSIAGIAGAEFDGDPTTPEGVRVQLAPGADPDHVGREVRRVLAGHGMRSQLTAPAVAPRTPPPPPEPRTVVNLADFDQRPSEAEADEDQDEVAGEDIAEAEGLDEPMVDDAPTEQPRPERSVAALQHVSVDQREGGVAISVTVGGRTARRDALPTVNGIDRALLSLVSGLLERTPEPALMSVIETTVEGTPLLTVLLDDGSRRLAGTAVDRGNRAWAVARAMWAALSGPA